MFKYLLPIVLAVTYSCASTSAEWSSWKIKTAPQEKQIWNFCDARFDGPELHRKGMCWIAKECRTRNPWYSGVKTQCRRLQLFCAWGDLECMDINGIFNKVIIDKGELK